MNAKKKLDGKMDKAFGAIEKLEMINAPNDTYEQVMSKLNKTKKNVTASGDYLKWAAVGLIILVNTFSYIKYQEQTDSSIEYQVSDLASDYGFNNYAYSEY